MVVAVLIAGLLMVIVCTFVGGNLVTWRSKKQNFVAPSSAEAEYRAMAHTAAKMIWVRSLPHI